MRWVRIDIGYVNANAVTFFVLLGLQQKFPLMFFMPSHINPESFVQIDWKRFELWSLVETHLGRPRLKVFFKKARWEQLFRKYNNIFRTHLITMKIWNNVLHAYPHNPSNFQVIWARKFLVMQFVTQQHFANPRLHHFFAKYFGPDRCYV